MAQDKRDDDREAIESDLETNPGIGQSKGTFATGENPEEIAGENTTEGDVGNDPDATGAVREDKVGRTNR